MLKWPCFGVGQPVGLVVLPRGGRLQIQGYRTVGALFYSGRAIPNCIARDGIVHQIVIGTVDRQRPELVYLRKCALLEAQSVAIGGPALNLFHGVVGRLRWRILRRLATEAAWLNGKKREELMERARNS
jgi:hypothetical protein